MTIFERKIADSLKNMKESYGLVGIKGEFEAEGATYDELCRLREITMQASVELYIKIGGCEAISDICNARTIGADAIIAPMIETPFAAKKFMSAIKMLYPKDTYIMPKVLLNIETIDGVKNIDKILELPEAAMLEGIDVGRVDMAGSYNLTPEESNSEIIFDACNKICMSASAYSNDISCTIGGFLNADTINFLQRLSESYKIQSESKKTIFGNDMIVSGKLRNAFLAAISFENMWYENCLSHYTIAEKENWGYFKKLQEYKKILEM